jgi:MIP family channel proteins
MSYLLERCVAEAIGTGFIVFFGCCAASLASTGLLPTWTVAPAFGIIVGVMIACTGHVSKAHFNPAVTLGFWTAGWIRTRDVLPYVLAQCIGAIAGSVLLQALLPSLMVGATQSALAYPQALGWELLLSFLLMFVIFSVATDERVDSALAPFAIGATVTLCAMVGGPMTGASMNPARSLGPALVLQVWDNFSLYLVGPILGAMLAVTLYRWMRRGDAVALRPREQLE